MSYNESQIDRDNKRWFKHDQTVKSLFKLTVSGGTIRGIHPSSIEFKYPITAIAGENGAGKSTLLALIACSFHNDGSFCPRSLQNNSQKAKRHYYTYSDFFTFTASEKSERGMNLGIKIESEYSSNSSIETKKTPGKDIRKKKASGKWIDYNTRPRRVVSFLGINRILPPAESKTYRNYVNKFLQNELSSQNSQDLCSAMTHIFGHNYSCIKMGKHNTYSLFSASQGNINYSGYNMGAGENAVLALLYEIISAGEGALIVIDEIELGIHISAQKNLINVLKNLCKKYKCQIVCSTHSANVLEALPPYARIMISSTDSSTYIMTDITTEFALGAMSNVDVPELSLFVEDEIGEEFIKSILDSDLRHRVAVYQVGSADGPIPRHMAAYYRENKHNYCCFMDGDQKNKRRIHEKTMKKELGDRLRHSDEEFTEYLNKRLLYLPGSTWPEKYLLEQTLEETDFSALDNWGVKDDSLKDYCRTAIASGMHNEFYNLSKKLGMEKNVVFIDIVRFYKKNHPDEIRAINDSIRNILQ